jgi:hypothetical protein
MMWPQIRIYSKPAERTDRTLCKPAGWRLAKGSAVYWQYVKSEQYNITGSVGQGIFFLQYTNWEV